MTDEVRNSKLAELMTQYPFRVAEWMIGKPEGLMDWWRDFLEVLAPTPEVPYGHR